MFNIKEEVERLKIWRMAHAGSDTWQTDQEIEFSELFNIGPSVYCIQFPGIKDAIEHYKIVHLCSLREAIKAIKAGLEQLNMEGNEI